MSKIPYNFDPIPQYFRKNKWLTPKKNGFHLRFAAFLFWAFGRCQSQAHKEFHDGSEVELGAFQFISGRDKAAEEIGITVEEFRALIEKLLKHGFLKKAPNKTPNRFTIYEWSTELFSENNPQQNPQVTPNKPPTNHHKEEEQNPRSEDLKESNLASAREEKEEKIAHLPASCLLPLTEEIEIQATFFLCRTEATGWIFEKNSVVNWLRKKYKAEFLIDTFDLFLRRIETGWKPDDLHKWFTGALKGDYLGEEKREIENKQWIEEIARSRKIGWIEVNKKYCTLIIGGGSENYKYKLKNFRDEIIRKIDVLEGIVG